MAALAILEPDPLANRNIGLFLGCDLPDARRIMKQFVSDFQAPRAVCTALRGTPYGPLGENGLVNYISLGSKV